MHKSFKVFRVSENTNSFGLKQFYAMSKDGVCFNACANSLNIPEKGSEIQIKQRTDKEGVLIDDYDFTGRGYEIPERLSEDAPKEVIEEVWA